MNTTPVAPTGALAALAAIDAAAVRALALIEAGQGAAPSVPAAGPEPSPATAAPRSLLAAAAQTAATEQTGLAPLFADLAAALRAPGLPPPVALAAARVQALATPLDPPLTAGTLKAAVAESGLMLEATIAATGAPPPNDMKAALLVLRQTLANALAAQPASAPPGAGPASEQQAQTQAGAPAARAPPAPLHAQAPPSPPYRDAPLHAQPPPAPRLPSDAPPAALVRALLQDVNGALARQLLFQLASLPGAPGPGATAPGDPTQPLWMFELPLATAQGATPTPFEISRDGGRSAAGGAEGDPTWRARFSLDLAAAGPVHARVSLAGGRLAVGLWAERSETAEALDADRGALLADLAGQQFEATVAVSPGQPAGVAADPGRFADRSL